MSKPMELTVSRRFQDRQGNDWYVWGDTCVKPFIADTYSDMKRITNPELAAEYWRAWSEMLDVPEDERYSYEPRRIATLRRFATLPHAAETGYQ